MDLILQPWPWWVSGILVGLTVPLMNWLTGFGFGISSSYRQIGAVCLPKSNLSYFRDYDKQKYMWQIVFVVGLGIGGFFAAHFLSSESVEFLPESFTSVGGAIRLLVGGFLIGFGARYAGGCTSGHAISGISSFNLPSVLATVCFFIGGLAVTWGLGRFIF